MDVPGGDDMPPWKTVSGKRIVVCLDLHNSMADRRARDALPRSRRFLRHNQVLFECFDAWRRTPAGKSAEIDLVDFVGDAGLLTFREGCADVALKFAADVIAQSRENGCLTAAGVDVGEVAVVDLYDEETVRARHAVGFPVDRAVRLSWIARPGEILSTGSVTSALNGSNEFDLGPTPEPVGVSLDKWPAEQVAVCGEVLVHSVHPRGVARTEPARPANAVRLADYFRRLQLSAFRFLDEAPHRWSALVDDFRRSERWRRREALERILEFLDESRAIDDGQLPELVDLRLASGDPLAVFCDTRDEVLETLSGFTRRYHDVTLTELERVGFADRLVLAAEELVLFSRANLRKLERRS